MFARRILGAGVLSAVVGPLLAGCSTAQMQVMKFEVRDLKVRMAHMEKEAGRQDKRMSALQAQVEEASRPQPAATREEAAPETKPAPKPRRSVRLNTRQIQQGLKSAGHSPGPIDGKMGPRTRAALRAFQRAEGMRATGQPDPDTMAAIHGYL